MTRTLVVGDIHGNYKALKQVLERSSFDYENDTLICLGDIVDGFTQTYECVEELLKIKNCILILGNHDAWFVSFIRYGVKPNVWIHQGGYNTLYSYNKNVDLNKLQSGFITDEAPEDLPEIIVPVTHQEFFNNAKLYHVQDNMIFVHGGFNPMVNIEKQSQTELCWNRELINTARQQPIYRNDVDTIDKKVLWKKVFVGHTTTQIDNGSTQPIIRNNLVMMDTGAGWNGKLTIMDVHTEQYWQSDRFEGQR